MMVGLPIIIVLCIALLKHSATANIRNEDFTAHKVLFFKVLAIFYAE